MRQIEPFYLYSHLNAAAVLHKLGRPLETLEIVNFLLSIEPEMAVAVFYRSLALIELNRFDEASSLIEKFETLVDAGRMPEAYLVPLRLNLALERGDAQESERQLAQGSTLFVIRR